MNPERTHRQFDTDLDVLRSAVTTMAGLVERQFVRAVDAVRLRDPGLAALVLADEQRVNQLQVESDLRCNQTIARRQPIAVDLREIVAVIHTVNDLERIGDEAKKIAIKSRDFQSTEPPIAMDGIERMTALVRAMLDAAIDAFVRHDPAVALQLGARDQAVDALRDELIAQLMRTMSERPQAVSPALSMVFVVQSIERVGDHAKNIAEYVVNVVEGIDLRHASPADLERGPSGS